MIQGKYLTGMDDISGVLLIRRAVFEKLRPDWANRDSNDDMAVFAVAFADGRPAASARLTIENDRFTLGRVCTLEEKRGAGLGDLVVRMLLVRALDLGANEVFVDPLPESAGFYGRYGFEPFEDGTLRATPESIDSAGGCSGKCH